MEKVISFLFFGMLILSLVVVFSFFEAAPPLFFLLGSSLCLMLFVSLIMTLITRRSLWWYLLVVSFALLVFMPFPIAIFLSLSEIRPGGLIFTLLASLPVAAGFVWHWAFHACSDEVVKDALVSKKIDIKAGRFSPFPFLSSMVSIQAKKIGNWVLIFMVTGSLFILIAASVLGGHWTGTYQFTAQIVGPVTSCYFFVLVLAALFGITTREFLWIRGWEKQNRRKMYVLYGRRAQF